MSEGTFEKEITPGNVQLSIDELSIVRTPGRIRQLAAEKISDAAEDLDGAAVWFDEIGTDRSKKRAQKLRRMAAKVRRWTPL